VPIQAARKRAPAAPEPAAAGRCISQIVLKAAARCNLNCSYCYVYNGQDKGWLARPKTVSDEVFGALLRRMNDYVESTGQPMSIGFHGGEPTLIGVARFERLVRWARRELGPRLRRVAIQTNATLITPEWARAIRELEVAPSISLDGPAHIHDASRVDLKGRGSHDRAVRGIRLLQAEGLLPNILCVVNPRLSGLEVYRHLRALNVSRMDFLLPDVSHDRVALDYGGLGPTPVAEYLLPIFYAWMEEDDPDVRVRIFHEIILKMLGGAGETDMLGSIGTSYLVVETDGSIETMDALRVCEDGMAKTGLNVRDHGFGELGRASPLAHSVIHGGIPPSARCRSCVHLPVCGGGYLPSRYSRRNQFDNPSVWCDDLYRLIDAVADYVNPRLSAAPRSAAQVSACAA
jgi:uncharacterized protein